MVYDGMRLTDKELIEILQIAKDNDGLVCVHAENYDSINYSVAKLLADGKTDPVYHAVSRPQKCEAEATNRAVKLDRKSTRLNSSHANISYAVFCLKKKILSAK